MRILTTTACTMEVLLEFQGSRRLLKPSSFEAAVELVLAEVKKVDPEALLRIGSDDADDSEQSDAKSRAYLLQKWPKKWETYVDVTAANKVEDGDKLMVIPKPGILMSVSCFVIVKVCQVLKL